LKGSKGWNFPVMNQNQVWEPHTSCKIFSDFELLHPPLFHDYINLDPNSFFTDFSVTAFLIGNDFISDFPDVNI
jgi:hypothetical protein